MNSFFLKPKRVWKKREEKGPFNNRMFKNENQMEQYQTFLPSSSQILSRQTEILDQVCRQSLSLQERNSAKFKTIKNILYLHNVTRVHKREKFQLRPNTFLLFFCLLISKVKKNTTNQNSVSVPNIFSATRQITQDQESRNPKNLLRFFYAFLEHVLDNQPRNQRI